MVFQRPAGGGWLLYCAEPQGSVVAGVCIVYGVSVCVGGSVVGGVRCFGSVSGVLFASGAHGASIVSVASGGSGGVVVW